MFVLENFAYNFCRELINIINANPSAESSKDILTPKYNQCLMNRHSDTTFLTVPKTPNSH